MKYFLRNDFIHYPVRASIIFSVSGDGVLGYFCGLEHWTDKMQIRYQLLSVAVTFAVAGNKIVLNNSRDSL